MIKIFITNTKCFIEGYAYEDWEQQKEFGKDLRFVLSYFVPGADFSPKFKENHWDGRISLYDWKTNSFPTGCLSLVINLLKEKNISYHLIDKRIKPEPNIELKTVFEEDGKSLFFYQEEAVKRAYKTGRGVLSLPTGSGKTLVACELLAQISTVPFLFYVPSISLLRQTHAEFIKYLRVDGHPPHIGFIGAGICDINPNGINITTYQSAMSAFNEIYNEAKNIIEHDDLAGEKVRKPTQQLKNEYEWAKVEYDKALKIAQLKFSSIIVDEPKSKRELTRNINSEISGQKKALQKAANSYNNRLTSLKNKKHVRQLIGITKGLIVDEVHVAAVIIECLGNHAKNAYWHIGLSATAYRTDNQEIRIQGTMGKKLMEISTSDLIDLGFLVPPKIYMVGINHLEKAEDYRDAYKKHIIHCWERNYRIKQFAEALKSSGRPVLILVEQIEHGLLLEQMIKDSVFVPGKDKGEDDPDAIERDYRRRMLNETESNNIILIATQWAYVGINAPLISALILAGSSSSAVAIYQMIGRVLRKVPGKTEAVVIDFMDKQKNLHDHSLNRKKIYKGERSWIFKQFRAI